MPRPGRLTTTVSTKGQVILPKGARAEEVGGGDDDDRFKERMKKLVRHKPVEKPE